MPFYISHCRSPQKDKQPKKERPQKEGQKKTGKRTEDKNCKHTNQHKRKAAEKKQLARCRDPDDIRPGKTRFNNPVTLSGSYCKEN